VRPRVPLGDRSPRAPFAVRHWAAALILQAIPGAPPLFKFLAGQGWGGNGDASLKTPAHCSPRSMAHILRRLQPEALSKEAIGALDRDAE